MNHRIRSGTKQEEGKLFATIEAGETYIGGKARNMHAERRRQVITGTIGTNKVPVFGMKTRKAAPFGASAWKRPSLAAFGAFTFDHVAKLPSRLLRQKFCIWGQQLLAICQCPMSQYRSSGTTTNILKRSSVFSPHQSVNNCSKNTIQTDSDVSPLNRLLTAKKSQPACQPIPHHPRTFLMNTGSKCGDDNFQFQTPILSWAIENALALV